MENRYLKRLRESAPQAHVVITDGADDRVLQAAAVIEAGGRIELTLLGDPDRVAKRAGRLGLSLKSTVRMPAEDPLLAPLSEAYAERRQVTLEEARRQVADPNVFGAMMVATDTCDGLLGGASVPTADVLRAGLRCIGLAPRRRVVSGAFGMLLKEPLSGGQDALLFADSAVVPQPNAEQLVSITENAVDSARRVLGLEPKVALLSFSTKGSAEHPDVDKMREALFLVQDRHPNWAVDGELQVDAAIVPEVAARKAPRSPLQGRANVLIFPDLDAGNIAYKLVQRVAGAEALGVLLGGFAKAVHDLSRGCSVEDIVHMVSVTALDAKAMPIGGEF